MAEDRRIVKTKTELRNTVVELISKEQFEKLTVKQICETAHISRLTFYSYYRDKYDLMDDIFNYYREKILTDHRAYNDMYNKEGDNITTLCNLLRIVVDFLYDNQSLVFSVNYEKNPYVKFAFHTFVQNCCDQILLGHVDEKNLKQPLKLTSTFLCNGISAYLGECMYGGFTREQTQESAYRLIYPLLKSQVFMK